VLERAAFVGTEEIGKGLAEAMANRGDGRWLAAQ
jgi:hypothetical protein